MLIRWKAPMMDWCKLNTNGISRGNPGMAGGRCAQNPQRLLFVCFCCLFWFEYKYVCGPWLCQKASEWLFKKLVRNLWIEVVFKVLLNMLIGNCHVPWKVKYIFMEINNYLLLFVSKLPIFSEWGMCPQIFLLIGVWINNIASSSTGLKGSLDESGVN